MMDLQTVGAAEAAPLALPSRAKQGPALLSPDKPSHALPPQCSDPSAYHRKLARVLDRMGGVYLLSDILTRIADGRMQSFVEGQSWAVTAVEDFPRAKQLLLVAMIGDLKDLDALHDKILAYADEIGAGLIATHGRLGWMREGSYRRLGWRLKSRNHLYVKEL